MNTITKLQILRCSSIFSSRESAIIHLNEVEHVVGQPVMVRYTTSDGETDTITAIGVRSGQGSSCYSIISCGEEKIVGDVFFNDLPDVSHLIHDINYVAKFNGTWSLFYISESGTQRQIRDLVPGDKFYSLKDSHMYFYSESGKLFRDDNELSLLEDKFSILSRGVLTISLDHENTLSKKGTRLNRPYLDISVLDSNGDDLTSECTYSVIDSDGNTISCEFFNGKLLLVTEINTTKEYTVTASYTVSNEAPLVAEGKIKFMFVDPVYYGTWLGEEKEVLWDGNSDLELVFNLKNQKNYIKVSAEWPRFSHIFDVNGLDYIDDYEVTRIDSWVTYKKSDAVTINNFVQTFKI